MKTLADGANVALILVVNVSPMKDLSCPCTSLALLTEKLAGCKRMASLLTLLCTLFCMQEFFDQSQAKKKELSAEYVNNQKTLDAALMPALNAEMKAYLATSFSLKDGDRPHLMKF